MSKLEPTRTSLDLTATERLRRMLDEADEYYKASGNKTWWGCPIDRQTGKPINVFHYQAQPMGEDRLFVELQLATPEQAIAATLGRGTCQDLGGTGANDEQVFNCSECGCVLSLYDRDGSNNLCTSFIFDYPRYCPECGRKVVTDG